ncbi:MAG: tRNA 2-thiouridine(34) synthase MnmA [Bacteroidales bacterium]|jgi:tRNA-specific 2-thiouridylase|nr:tRNA 2-thiouridine(34) synthase MnmA [Bacteroidales bacterium]
MTRKTVLVAMSGGIDSTVAARLLLLQGHSVAGLFISFFNETWAHSQVIEQQKKSQMHVEKTCSELHIPFFHKDMSEYFYTEIVSYFVSEYAQGRTPFPCAVCNPKVKWKTLFDTAQELGYSYIATGHYTEIVLKNNIHYIRKGKDYNKDQSFFLWALPQHILEKTIFPLSNITKEETYSIAKSHAITSAQKKESTGVCFLHNGDYRAFVMHELYKKGIHIPEGTHRDLSGNVISKNKGYIHYTVGQRKKLGINLNKRVFVHSIHPEQNTILLSDYASLYKTSFTIINYYFHSIADTQKKLIVKIRYREQATECTITSESESSLIVHLCTPLESIAPGQTAVFYDGDCVVGGGFIQ